ncbi:MAG: bifunctional serine/threonine-protein kinase/formylglycine-generating enzyme family protein [Arenimonas sp.]
MQQEELSPEELSALLSSYMPDIPGYRVLRRIGKGGMSQVYLGVQESLDRQVAIKVMSPEALADEVSKQRFEQEARTIAKLEHPCIVGIHEVGRSYQGLMYYVLPYLAKGHLGQRDFTNDEARTFEVLRALLSALEYAHARGIVHRDVKAENVLFDNADRPLLTDFGIALSKKDNTRITTAGLAVGSGGYMAPEQARGEAVDGRADLYSVGVLAYELVTGRLPYLANDPLALALMHAQDPIPRLSADKKHWQGFIDRAMAKMPENRFRNAQQMLGALNQLADTPRQKAVMAPAVVVDKKTKVSGSSKSWFIPVLLSIAGLSLIGFGVKTWLSHDKTPAEKNNFFVAEKAEPEASKPVTTVTPSVPTPVIPAPAPAIEPANIEIPPVEPPPTPAPTVAENASPFAGVKSGVVITTLDYDPTVPGAKFISSANKQIKQNRLTAPPGDNAIESLLAARKAAPTNPAIAALSDVVIDGLAKNLDEAVKTRRDEAAKTAYLRVEKFAVDADRKKGKSWLALRDALPALLITRLQKDTGEFNSSGIAGTKALAGKFEIEQSLLEPAWSKANVMPQPRVGDIVKAEGPSMVLTSIPNAARAGLAIMREEVTKGEYASFSSANNRAATVCRNAFASMFSGKISWDKPGFNQSNEHPVVCVSHTDAIAYAQWLSKRTGLNYRLPTQNEWRSVVSYKAGDPCRAGVISCGNKGTAAGSGTPASPLGIYDLQGNASEWLSDSAGSGRYTVAGLSWRDASSASSTRTSNQNGDRGYDDVGFRLVREVSLSELAK